VPANIVVRWNVNHPGLRVVCNGRPVLAAMQAGTERRGLAGSGLMVGIDFGPPGFRIETFEDILIHIRFAFDKLDRPVGTVEEQR